MKREVVSLAALTGLLAFAGVAPAQVLFTTQEDFSGWSGGSAITAAAQAAPDTDGSAINGLGNTAAAGAAGTAGSLGNTWVSGTYNAINSPGEQGNAAFLAALGTTNTGAGYTAGSGTVAFDYTVPPAGNGNYFQLNLLLNYDSNYGQFSGGTDVDNGDGTHTRTIPYTIDATGGSSYFQLGIIYNSNYDTSTPFTIDNVRVVPEPASLSALAGISAGVLCARRRRRQ